MVRFFFMTILKYQVCIIVAIINSEQYRDKILAFILPAH